MDKETRRILNMFVFKELSEKSVGEYRGLPLYATGTSVLMCVDEVNREFTYIRKGKLVGVSLNRNMYEKMNFCGQAINYLGKGIIKREDD